MVNQKNPGAANEIDFLTEEDKLVILDHHSHLLSSIKKQPRENLHYDDLIVSLTDAYENKRARQVIEWEQMRLQNIHQAA